MAPALCPVGCSRHVPHLETGMRSWSWPGCLAPGRSVNLSSSFSPFLCRTRKMGSQRPSSSEKGRRKARSTGNASHAALCPALSSSTCWLPHPPNSAFSLYPVASSPPHGCLVQTGQSYSWNLLCTLSPTGYLTLSHQPFIPDPHVPSLFSENTLGDMVLQHLQNQVQTLPGV